MARTGQPDTKRSAGAPCGVGLGLRWDFLEEVLEAPLLDIDFFEVSPENYMRRGGYYPAALERIGARYPLVSHGLMLSIGAQAPLDSAYLETVRLEVARLRSPWHSDHLCFSSSGSRMLHELLPLKFAEDTVSRIAERVHQVEDAVGVPFALENISYYAHPGRREMPEPEFVARVLERSGAALLLDVNNVYVNARNHGTDPLEFLEAMPLDRVVEIHVAGHHTQESGLVLDTHGASVCDPVLDLLTWSLERTGPVPVLLERDNEVPPLPELLREIATLRGVYERSMLAWQQGHARSA